MTPAERDFTKAKNTFLVFAFLPYDQERHTLEIAEALATVRQEGYEAGREDATDAIEQLILECGDYTVLSPTGQERTLEWVLRDALANTQQVTGEETP